MEKDIILTDSDRFKLQLIQNKRNAMEAKKGDNLLPKSVYCADVKALILMIFKLQAAVKFVPGEAQWIWDESGNSNGIKVVCSHCGDERSATIWTDKPAWEADHKYCPACGYAMKRVEVQPDAK